MTENKKDAIVSEEETKEAKPEKDKQETMKELKKVVKDIEDRPKLNLYQKLNKIQSELSVPKEQKNVYGGYNYRSLEDILGSLKLYLDKYEVVILLSDEIQVFSGKNYIKATARLVDCNTGETISTSAFAREPDEKKGKMDESQTTGSASSYARKYALNALLAIDDNKDPDTNEHREQTTATNNRNQNYNNQHQFNNQQNNQQQFNKQQQFNQQPNQQPDLNFELNELNRLAQMKNQVNAMPEIIRSRFGKANSKMLTIEEILELKDYLKGL